MTSGPWSLVHVSQMVEEVGGALLSAHVAGVTHGDVRSANVMLDDGGNTYLTDFGIAVAGDEATDFERRVRSDIADFAAMLWELLAATSPRLDPIRAAGGSTSHAAEPCRRGFRVCRTRSMTCSPRRRTLNLALLRWPS